MTNDNNQQEKTTQTYGTIRISEGINYVLLDGSEILTPCDSTVNAVDGDRVLVMVKNHTATVYGVITTVGGETINKL